MPPASLETTVDDVVARLLRHSPAALALQKRLYAEGLEHDRRSALDHELDVAVGHLTQHPDVGEGLAAFREKRPPRFAGNV